MAEKRPRIAVIGSINMDLVVRCAALPNPGETLLAQSSQEICGGKGANQAVAAARAGGLVTMIGRVGDDAFAQRLVANLDAAKISTEHVSRTENCASGLAIVAVDDQGQNSILVVPGANGKVSVADLHKAHPAIESSDIVLVQLETPLDTVVAAIEMARAAGVRVVVDPAPAPAEWPAELFQADLLCPNESEAGAFTESPVKTVEQAEAAARDLYQYGASHIAVTLGARGTLLFDGEQSHLVDPFPVQAVDSTAAGDAFAGAVAVYWAESGNLFDAIRFGNAAGALSATRNGAQPSMASREEIEALWRTKQ